MHTAVLSICSLHCIIMADSTQAINISSPSSASSSMVSFILLKNRQMQLTQKIPNSKKMNVSLCSNKEMSLIRVKSFS